MKIALGIDTGGTYTDAVLIDQHKNAVLAAAKSLTTRDNLSVGITRAISNVLRSGKTGVHPDAISFVSLSTTLATNAIAEGHGGPVCLLLIGYDPELIRQYHFQDALCTRDVVYIKGGHDIYGDEQQPLDETTVRQAILARRQTIDAFAVSGFFSAYNPDHERRVKHIITDCCDLPVTCGHELSTRLDSIRRATTVALNARLIPLIQDLLTKIRSSLADLKIRAPLMVVKGDGSLVRAEWAAQRPIETVLSGPAASAVGALTLAGNHNGLAVDVGGTTTDIVELNDGRPTINPQGANIGGWRTMVEAVDVYTMGLGGDSHVRFDAETKLHIGPQRVVPICKLASENPQILDELQRQQGNRNLLDVLGQFLILVRRPGNQLADKDQTLIDRLAQGPYAVAQIVKHAAKQDPWIFNRIQQLERRHWIQRAGFTPTDALHVLNRFRRWRTDASLATAELLAAVAGSSTQLFCENVVLRVSKMLARLAVNKIVEDHIDQTQWEAEPAAATLMRWALGDNQQTKLDLKFTLNRPLVALGAPVEAYMPASAGLLNTQLIIPERADVANAIGAVSGGIMQNLRVVIRPLEGGTLVRLYLPDASLDFAEIEDAVEYAQKHVPPIIEARARLAGATQIEASVDRKDKRARLKGNQEVYLGTELVYTAFGRPRLADQSRSA